MEFTNGTCMLGPLKRGVISAIGVCANTQRACVQLPPSPTYPHSLTLCLSLHNTESLEPAGFFVCLSLVNIFANLCINSTSVGHSEEGSSWEGGEQSILLVCGSAMLHLKGVC